MENFIKFCRSLGVHENLLFESDDLGTYILVIARVQQQKKILEN